MAAASGFSVAELFTGGKGQPSKRSAATKYRNPKDTSQTWSGRCRKPNWLTAAVDKGQKIESFEV